MQQKNNQRWVKLILAGIVIFVLGCGLFQNPETVPTQTETPTNTPEVGNAPTTPAIPNRCEGVSGSLEMQVLAGPAEAVGMEPYAVGDIPFSVEKGEGKYFVQGGGDISYHQVLEKEWGTYTVTLDMATVVSGDCSGETGNETLNIIVEASGEQMVEVRSTGFSGDYPWSGTHLLELDFPLEEGASAEGEGWAFILHFSE